MTMRASTRRRRRSNRADRDEKGRFKVGISGNPKGRRRKKPELPQVLPYQLAEAMEKKLAVIQPDGKTRMVCAYDLAVQRLTECIPTANQKELIQILSWLDKFGVFWAMRERAEKMGAEPSISKDDRELLAQVKSMLAEKQEEARAAGLEEMERARKGKAPGTKRPRSKAA